MNKQDAIKRIEAIEAEAAALRKLVQEPEVGRLWRPTMGEDYWFFGGWDTAFRGRFAGDILDQRRIALGLCFPAKEAAEKAFPLFARANKVIQAALQADPNAGLATDERRWTATYDRFIKLWVVNTFLSDNHVAVVYVHTREQAERMAAILNAEGV